MSPVLCGLETKVTLITKYPAATRGKLVVWSSLATFPFGGMTWHRLHYLVGLRRLGFDVWYVEDSDRPVYHPTSYCPTLDYAENVNFLARQMDRIGLGDRWVFRPPGVDGFCLGATDLRGLNRLYKTADAAFNLSGAQELRPEHSGIRCLIYVETDPVVNQVAVAKADERTIRELASYDYLFTYGENLGAADCLVPIERFEWLATRAPVCLDWWNGARRPVEDAALTTVLNWKHTGKDVTWQGETYHWSKHYEFLRFMDLPSRSALPLELALGAISEDERVGVRNHGWRVVPSASISEPSVYRQYVRASLGEFTAAKEQYVRTRSGWFSDRSACYLAAGRPVITQDTAFGNILPSGEGLLSFSTEQDAVAAIEAVARDYPRHAAAAHEIALEYFDAQKVLGSLLGRVGLL